MSSAITLSGPTLNYVDILQLVIYVYVKMFTVFTDVQLFEVNQAGDGGGQVGQVVIGHAQLLQGLAVEELLWGHKGMTKAYYGLLGKTLNRKIRCVQKVSWMHAALNVVENLCHFSCVLL